MSQKMRKSYIVLLFKRIMVKGKHESISSEGSIGKPVEGENGEGRDLHESVSGEGGYPTEVGTDQVAESFEGKLEYGEIEGLEGFDPSRAFTEGGGTPFLTDEYLNLQEHAHPEGAPPETVCGSDDRVQVVNTTPSPWRWVCQLIITMANGGMSRCTGWFIGRKTVMTAGHCVFMKAAGGWVRRVEVIPGMNGAGRPYGSQIGTSFRSVQGWIQDGDWNYDYGAIILPDNTLGDRVGYFGFASLTDASLQNLLVNNSGYPGDKPFGTQWFNAGRITSITARKIYYMVDTAGGQSGSPVWRFQNNERHAIGIHAYGGCPNSATRIIPPVYNNMLAWRNL
jgi:glutamyl endopeptidase